MINIKKATSKELRAKLFKINRLANGTKRYSEISENFNGLVYEIDAELNRRNHAAIYRIACRVLKNKGFNNQFAAAAYYADAVINGCDYTAYDDQHEIGGFYTKSGNPVIVYFD